MLVECDSFVVKVKLGGKLANEDGAEDDVIDSVWQVGTLDAVDATRKAKLVSLFDYVVFRPKLIVSLVNRECKVGQAFQITTILLHGDTL